MKTTLLPRIFILACAAALPALAPPRASAGYTNIIETFETIGGSSIGEQIASGGPNAATLEWSVSDNGFREVGNGGGLGLGANRAGGNGVFFQTFTLFGASASGGAFNGNLMNRYGSNFVLAFDYKVNYMVGGDAPIQVQLMSGNGYSGNQSIYTYTNAIFFSNANTGTWQHVEIPFDLSDPNVQTVEYAPSGWTASRWSGTGASFYQACTNEVQAGGANSGYFRIVGLPSLTGSGAQQELDNFQIFSIPEPSALLAMAAGLAGLLALRGRRRA